MANVVYMVVKLVLKEGVDPEEGITECDYEVKYEDKIIETEVMGGSEVPPEGFY